ncbi:MAG: hypothetical protein LC664_06530, partial [Flavobacteriales bacterium]|nr:hypothetical protein [Flavobacteriales bacterium]
MDFRKYDAEDFALLDSFRKWVLSSDKETNLFWSEWLAKNPEKRKTLELARKIVENMPSAQHHLS